jgi:micrococcal nuclease
MQDSRTGGCSSHPTLMVDTLPMMPSPVRVLRITVSCLAVIAFLLTSCSSSSHAPQGKRERAVVERVIDGDTLVLAAHGRRGTYRLLAIDAPELSASSHAERQARKFKIEASKIRQLGKISKRRLEEILPRFSDVEFEFDVKRRDKYQRPLIYLYLPGDSRSLNEQLLAEGSVWFFDPSPNNRLVRRMRSASELSRKERRGVWIFSGSRP